MYEIARNSTVRMIVEQLRLWAPKVDYTEWDGHAENYKLPEKDLIGLLAFSCTENDRFHDLTFGIAVMTFNDPSLGRSTRYVNAFYNRLLGQSTYPIYSANGTLAGFNAVVFDGTSVSPMQRVDARPTVEINVSARLTRVTEKLPQSA